MKKLLFALLFTAFVIGCSEQHSSIPQTPPTVVKTVAEKKEAVETDYSYKYNVWKGDFYQQPDVHTVYYLIFTDGSTQMVDLGKYSSTNVGDSLTVPIYY